MQAAVPTPSGEYRGRGGGNKRVASSAGGDGWTPRYGPQYPYCDQPTGYKLNVYIPGNAPLKSSKMNSATQMEQDNTFSTFGKKSKRSSPQDMELDRTLS